MASSMRQGRTEQRASCFTRAARWIRRALSRICRDNSPSEEDHCNALSNSSSEPFYPLPSRRDPIRHSKPVTLKEQGTRYASLPQKREPDVPGGISRESAHMGDYDSLTPRGPCLQRGTHKLKKKKTWGIFRRRRSFGPPHLNSLWRQEAPPLSKRQVPTCIPKERGSCEYPPSFPLWRPEPYLLKESCVEWPLTMPPPTADPDTQNASASSPRINLESEVDGDVLIHCEQGAAATAVICSVANTLPPPSQISTFSLGPDCIDRVSGSFPRSHSSPSLSHMTSAEGQTLTRARSLPELLLKTSYEQFTPDMGTDEGGSYNDMSISSLPGESDGYAFGANKDFDPPQLDISIFVNSESDSNSPVSDFQACYSFKALDVAEPKYDYSCLRVQSFQHGNTGNYSRVLDGSQRLPQKRGPDVPGQFPSEAMETELFDPPPSKRQVPTCIPRERGSCEYPTLFPQRGPEHYMIKQSCVEWPLTMPPPTAHPDTQNTSASSPRKNLESEGDDLLMDCEQGAAATAVICSVANTLPPSSQISTFSSGPDCSERVSGSFPRSHSSPSLSHMTSAEGQTLTRARSLPKLLLKTSYEQFTPDISTDGEDETYRFHCSRSGLYQCIMTGLLFQMEREGDVVYGTVPWDRKLLSQHHKQPAGPLFEISCEQQSVCQLHLPHCEISSTGGAQHLSVAHVNQEGVEFIVPHKITETHLVINISSFSGFGNVKDEDSPSVPIRALVLLFYRPPVDPDRSSLLNVLLLPKNVVLRDVQRIRKKTVGDERYIETSPHCKLHPQQDYTLSTCPEDSSVLVEPTTAEFDSEDYDNYFPSFQVTLEQTMKHIQLSLKHTSSSISVWDRRVCLQSSRLQRSCGQSALNLPPSQRLLDIRSSFIEGVSGPVLKSLLDKLFEKTVMVESEWESVDGIPNKSDKARFVIDTVRKKGEAASSEMMEALCELDLFLSEHLGLI